MFNAFLPDQQESKHPKPLLRVSIVSVLMAARSHRPRKPVKELSANLTSASLVKPDKEVGIAPVNSLVDKSSTSKYSN